MSVLDDIRGIHSGKPAFVLGSGPSLRFFDYDLASKAGVIFSTNSSLKLGLSPDYHVVFDPACAYLRSFVDGAPNVKRKILVSGAADRDVRTIIKKYHGDLLHGVHTFDFQSRAPLSREAEKITQWSTTPISAAHLAIVCGCNPIVLVGCDCCWESGKRYFYEFDNMNPADDPLVNDFTTTGYIREHRRIEGVDSAPVPFKPDLTTVGDGQLGSALFEWGKIASMLPQGVEILNGGIGARLKVFRMFGVDALCRNVLGSRVTYVDIDGTLTDNGSAPWGNLITERLEKLKSQAPGSRLYAWSAQGEAYVRQFLEYHGIAGMFYGVADKPDVCYDDVPTIRPNLQIKPLA